MCIDQGSVIVECGATKSGSLLLSRLDAELTHEGTVSLPFDTVRQLTTSYSSDFLSQYSRDQKLAAIANFGHFPKLTGQINRRPCQSGTTLIELIMFIVIVGAALAGILQVMSLTTVHSADVMLRKQSLAIASSLLEEVELMPFTYCDPDDANAASATSAVVGGTGCAAYVEGIGPETIGGVVEDRYGGTNTAATNAYFDNVNDYDGFTMNAANGGIKDINFPTDPAIAKLSGYSASISIAPQALGTITATDSYGTAQSLLIKVTVTAPDGNPVVLEGYRTRYAPNDLP